MQYTFTEVAFI